MFFRKFGTIACQVLQLKLPRAWPALTAMDTSHGPTFPADGTIDASPSCIGDHLRLRRSEQHRRSATADLLPQLMHSPPGGPPPWPGTDSRQRGRKCNGHSQHRIRSDLIHRSRASPAAERLAQRARPAPIHSQSRASTRRRRREQGERLARRVARSDARAHLHIDILIRELGGDGGESRAVGGCLPMKAKPCPLVNLKLTVHSAAARRGRALRRSSGTAMVAPCPTQRVGVSAARSSAVEVPTTVACCVCGGE